MSETVGDIFRIVIVVFGFALSGAATWRVIYSPLPHQRFITLSMLTFGIVSVMGQVARFHDDFNWRLPLILLALAFGGWGLHQWTVYEQDSTPGSFGSHRNDDPA